MDIAALSMSMSMANVQQQASISVLKKAMDSQTSEMANLLQAMPSTPSSGHSLDVYA